MQQTMSRILLALVVLAPVAMSTSESNPTSKVVDLIGQLQTKMIAKGEASQKIYNEFAAWCSTRAQELGLEIKDGKGDVQDLNGQIKQDQATIDTKDIEVDEEAEDIHVSEKDLNAALKLRKAEMADFATLEKELIDVIGMLKRAIAVLESEMAKHGASMLQIQGATNFAEAVRAMVEASLCSSEDAKKLASLMQTKQDSDMDDTEAPASSVYSGASGGIIKMMRDLLEKAESQLSEARSKETTAHANFQMLQGSLKDEIKYSKSDKSEAHQQKNGAKEEKSIDEGDLGMTVADVKDDVHTLDDLRRVCMQKVEEFTAMAKSRDEELKALASAKKVIKEEMGGATESVYKDDGAFFLQVSSRAFMHKYGANGKSASNSVLSAETTVRQLAKKTGAVELSQLVSRISAAVRTGQQTGEDPFAKIVGMISDMITKLEQEASEDAEHEAYCDKETADATAKREERADTVESMSTKMHQMMARSHKLKEQVKKLQKGLAELAAAQSEMDKIRSEENAEFLDEKASLDQGMDGVKMALTTLRDYYGKTDKAHKTTGASDNIISLLETIESDFSQSRAELIAGERASLEEYETQTQDNKVSKADKETAVEHKTKEFTSLDKGITDLKSDRSGVQSELDAVIEYLAKLKKECIVMPDSYEERKKRRQAEIAGLKEALNTLESETALLQKKSRRSLRGQPKLLIAH